MKLVYTTVLLVMLLASVTAVPRWAAYDDGKIADGPYWCMQTSNCAGLKLANVRTVHECCYHVGGGGFWDFVKCTPW